MGTEQSKIEAKPGTSEGDTRMCGEGSSDLRPVESSWDTLQHAESSDNSQDVGTDSVVPCEFICGCAGSGKTFMCRERIEGYTSWGVLAATTGISAINLGTTTINSLLHFFDT